MRSVSTTGCTVDALLVPRKMAATSSAPSTLEMPCEEVLQAPRVQGLGFGVVGVGIWLADRHTGPVPRRLQKALQGRGLQREAVCAVCSVQPWKVWGRYLSGRLGGSGGALHGPDVLLVEAAAGLQLCTPYRLSAVAAHCLHGQLLLELILSPATDPGVAWCGVRRQAQGP